MVWAEPLDLWNILVLKLAGSPEIFMFLAFLIIAIMAARFRMTGGVFATVFLIFCFLMTPSLGSIMTGIMILIVTGIIYLIATSIGRRLL